MRTIFLLSLCLILLLPACAPKPTPGPEASSLLPTTVVTQPTSSPKAAALPATETVSSITNPSIPSTQSGQLYPLTTETGQPEIDALLAVLANGDKQALIGQFSYLSTACQTVNGLGGPPACRAGEPEGTLVSVLPTLGSEGSFIHADAVDAFPGLEVAGIYAIFQNSASAYQEDLFPAGEYTILLRGAGGVPGYALRVADGKIVRLEYYFDLSAFRTLLSRDAAQFILEPVQ